jgi:UDP-N-acetylglucosamine 2-epimerase (non-hydrolysing)
MAPRLLVVVGARPNFVKVAPVIQALDAAGEIGTALLHTGQHYDHSLSDSFLEQLAMPEPDFFLGVGSGTHAEQTAGVLLGTEGVLREHEFDAVLVAGDVNSTLAAALAAAKLGVAVIHLEAGLRSGDWTMPEEINRTLTDRLSDLLLCPSADALRNLADEGISSERACVIGNTMIDSLLRLERSASARDVLERLGLQRGRYALVTLHRPALVDDAELLAATLDALGGLASSLPVLFPVHPRTRASLSGQTFHEGSLTLLDPLDYLDFVALMRSARLVVTDSGGVQEETTVLGVPCLTYRTTTERPITVSEGTNRVVGLDPEALRAACARVLAAHPPASRPRLPLWDGRAGERAAEAIARFMGPRQEAVSTRDM